MSYILCPEKNVDDGEVYTIDIHNLSVLVIFDDEDDATRYSDELRDKGKELVVIEIDKELAIEMCEMNGYNYTIVETNDLVLPLE
tara:strand:- start:648 stop:902 length:255 start_codon:yes stop_codon:yes gene_type:complete